MNCKTCFAIIGAAAITLTGSFALAHYQDTRGANPPQEPQLPPGWTEADMQACIAAGTPGEMHAFLAEGVGVWRGKTKMWMAPGTEALTGECTSTATAIFDGRFIHVEMQGSSPAMGEYHGSGVYGYNNVAETFECAWIDNHSTGIMNGTGDRSYDGKTITWTYNYYCPITKKPVTLREVETITGQNTRTFEMFGIDPKSGKEFKMMEINFTRASTPGGTIGGGADR